MLEYLFRVMVAIKPKMKPQNGGKPKSENVKHQNEPLNEGFLRRVKKGR